MMREWVDELTGRTDRAATGLRVPGEAEISQLMSMFPDMRREDVVGALQRRYVTRLPRGKQNLNIAMALPVLISRQQWRHCWHHIHDGVVP